MSRELVLKGSDGLSERQLAYVKAILAGKSEEQALKVAGYTDGNISGGPGRSLAVRGALAAGRTALIRGELSSHALKAMRELLRPSTAAATRFAAAKWILEHGEDAAADEKPVHLMSESELIGFMQRAQAVLDEGGQPPVIDVTPTNGA